MAPVYDIDQFRHWLRAEIGSTKMTGHLSLADVQAKEVESLVLERAEFESAMESLDSTSEFTHELWDRTPF